MTLIICIVLALLAGRAILGEGRETADERENLISDFIARYAAHTGIVLTRCQAERLIRRTVELHGADLVASQNKESEYGNAKAAVARLCAEAERKAARRSRE